MLVHGAKRPRVSWRCYLTAAVFLAFCLRALPLTRQAIWGDEGISIFLASHSARYVIDNVGKVHPPGYFLLIHWFSDLAGYSAFVVRLPSVLLGVLSVPLIYQVGRLLFSRNIGLVAAFLMAVSPYHIARSQDARMYPLVIFLSLLSLYLMLVLMASHDVLAQGHPFIIRRRLRLFLWCAYILVNATALFVHYYVALFILAQTAFMLFSRKHGGTRVRVSWISAQAALALLFTPWLIYFAPEAWRGVTEKVTMEQASSFGYLSYWQGYLRVVGTGYLFSGWAEALVVAVLGLGICAWRLQRRDRQRFPSLSLCLVLLLAPVTMGFFINTRWPVVDFPRLLSPTSIPLYTLAALGLIGLGGLCRRILPSIVWASAIPFVVLAAGGIYNLVGYYQMTSDSQAGANDDRPLVKELSRQLQTQDAVLAETRAMVGDILAYTSVPVPPTYYVSDVLPAPSNEEHRKQAFWAIWQARADIREAYLDANGWAQERWLDAMEDWWSKTQEAKDVEGDLIGLATWGYGYLPDGYAAILDDMLQRHGRLWFPYFQWPGNYTGMAIEDYLTRRYQIGYEQNFGRISLRLFILPSLDNVTEEASSTSSVAQVEVGNSPSAE